MFCNSEKTKQCSDEVKDLWDELYGRLAGRASVAYVELDKSRATQKRFKVLHNDLPAIFYISKGKWYRYRVIRDQLDTITPLLNLEDLETFVVNRDYEDIPKALPEDFGEIPPVPGVFDILQEYVQNEVSASGGWSGLLFFKNESGEPNYAIAISIYAVIILIAMSACFVINAAYSDIMGMTSDCSQKSCCAGP